MLEIPLVGVVLVIGFDRSDSSIGLEKRDVRVVLRIDVGMVLEKVTKNYVAAHETLRVVV